MEAWVAGFDSWDVCDQATTSLFDASPHAWRKVGPWTRSRAAWKKRAGFALIAGLAAHDRASPDARFLPSFALIERGAFDERNFVKKAVSWALRNLGKRSVRLHEEAVACASRILAAANERAGGPRGGDPDVRAARWVATDALRELRSPAAIARLRRPRPASPEVGRRGRP
jgi:3-methyladenine DNA glycosylase AlkD